jgi:hypothetical protein
MYHHGRFMARTNEPSGWTSQFRELVLTVNAPLHDLRGGDERWSSALDRDDYRQSQILAKSLRAAGSEGLVYPSQRDTAGQCVGLFFPNYASNVIQARHLDYHWSGTRVDLYRDPGSGELFRVD